MDTLVTAFICRFACRRLPHYLLRAPVPDVSLRLV